MKNFRLVLAALVMPGILVGCSEKPPSSVPAVAEGHVAVNVVAGERQKIDLTIAENLPSWVVFPTHYVDRNPNVKRTKAWAFMDTRDFNGKPISAGYVLKDNTKVGYWVHWYENGQKKRESEFKENGEKHAHWIHWYENGQKSEEGKWKDGKRIGSWSFWNEDGSIDNEKSGIYKAGKKVAPLPKKK